MDMMDLILIPTGIISSILPQDWRESPYIEGLKRLFESIHEQHQTCCASAVGYLVLKEGDSLFPGYMMKTNDGSYKEITIDNYSIQLSDLISDAELKDEIKKDGFLVVTKFFGKE